MSLAGSGTVWEPSLYARVANALLTIYQQAALYTGPTERTGGVQACSGPNVDVRSSMGKDRLNQAE